MLHQTFVLPRVRNREENREYRRESLIQGAIAAVALYDITNATVDLICRHAGVSRGLIAHYFDSKEHLLVVACETIGDQAMPLKREIMDDSRLSGLQKLRRIAKTSLQAPTYNRQEMAAWQAFTNASRSHAIYRQPIQAHCERLTAMYCSLFEQAAVEQGKIIHARHAGLGLGLLLDGLWSSLLTGKDGVTTDAAISICEQYLHGLLSETTAVRDKTLPDAGFK